MNAPPSAGTATPSAAARPPAARRVRLFSRIGAGLALTMLAGGAVGLTAQPAQASPGAVARPSVAGSVDRSHPTHRAVTAPTHRVTVDGLSVAYRSFGRGPVLLLTPCLGLSMDDWDPALLDGLAAHHRVIIFDSDGIGRTPAGASASLSVKQLSDQAAGLISALRLKRPIVVGYSLGGFVAQRLAVDHAGSVGALVLMGTSPGGAQQVMPDLELNAPLLDPSVPADRLFPLYFNGHPQELIDWRKRTSARPHRVGVALPGLNRQRAALGGWLTDPTANVADRLPGLRLPTLVLGARDDQQQPVDNSSILAATIPGARLKLYSGLGHAFPFEAPRRVVADITAFTHHR